VADLKAVVDGHNALVYARKHLKTHMDWVTYLKAGNPLPCEEVGDLEHHEQAIEELNVICAVLREGKDRD
jgi:hypothetical protein